MKPKKGEAGYIPARKKQLLLYTLIEFSVVCVLLLTGYLIYHTKLNFFTLFAVLGVLPASKMLVETIAIFPYATIDRVILEDIESKSPNLTKAYDLVVTNTEKAMPIDAVAISNHSIYGFSSSPKCDTDAAAKLIREILLENNIQKPTVKVFSEYVPFLSRVEGLNSIIEVNHQRDVKLEKSIRHIILNISM